jgi:hypothetical protein
VTSFCSRKSTLERRPNHAVIIVDLPFVLHLYFGSNAPPANAGTMGRTKEILRPDFGVFIFIKIY